MTNPSLPLDPRWLMFTVQGKEPNVELLVIVGVIVSLALLAILALRYGADSRDVESDSRVRRQKIPL